MSCQNHPMSNLQIKGIPEDLHEELRRRAAQAGSSLRDYVLELIRRDLAGPSKEDWLLSLRELTPADLGGPAADLIAADRATRGSPHGDRD